MRLFLLPILPGDKAFDPGVACEFRLRQNLRNINEEKQSNVFGVLSVAACLWSMDNHVCIDQEA